MPRRLVADGSTGRVAIQYGASRLSFEQPVGNLKDIHFHSDLDYLAVEQVFSGTVTFNKVEGQSKTESGGKKGKDTITTPILLQGFVDHNLGPAVGDATAPLIGFVNDVQLGGGTMTLYRGGNQSGATRLLGVTIVAGNLILREQYVSYGQDIPAQTFNVRFLKFAELRDDNTTLPYTLQIAPDRFIASKGKLDSNLRYTRRVANPQYVMFFGRTMDLQGDRLAQIRTDGSSVGDFTMPAIPTIGVEV